MWLDTDGRYSRDVCEGISRFQATALRPWSVQVVRHDLAAMQPSDVLQWQGHGIITRVDSEAMQALLQSTGLPVINVSGALEDPVFPTFVQDAAPTARLAVDYFLDLGFRRFAFFGARGPKWSQARLRHFRRLLDERSHALDHLLLPMVKDTFEDDHAELDAWLQQLPRPVAILASDDRAGLRLLNACLQLGLQVPDEVAVLGVDNDEIICRFASPPLSSIELDGLGAGFRAAQLLDRLMHGDALPERLVTPLPPRGIVHRRSTDLEAIADPHVALAVRLIHAEACQGVQVADIVRRIPLARRPLENRFKALIGRTMREEIWRVQFDRAKSLLRDTTLPLRSVADACGFEHVEYFSAAFKKFVGEAPGRYRQSINGLR